MFGRIGVIGYAMQACKTAHARYKLTWHIAARYRSCTYVCISVLMLGIVDDIKDKY